MTIFAEIDFNNIHLTYFVQYADQHESVHQLYRRQHEIGSVVSISE